MERKAGQSTGLFVLKCRESAATSITALQCIQSAAQLPFQYRCGDPSIRLHKMRWPLGPG